jgi:thiamine biosynthesis lipoprotein
MLPPLRRARLRLSAGLLAAAAALLAPAVASPGRGGPVANAATADAPRERKVTHTGTAMGTTIQVTFWTDDEKGAASAAAAVLAEFARLDAMMTTWTSDSEVSKINAAAGKSAVKVSDETFAVIARALEVAKASKGIFDITVGAFQGLWKFDEDLDGTLPDPKEVARRRKLVDYKQVVLDKKAKSVKLKKKGMAITLGGIAKGYAVDKAVALLHEAGFSDFIMQAGGDLYVSGKKSTAPWVVGIRDPRAGRDVSFAVAPIEDHAFSTSGDYERGFVKDGVRYHHILDPRTGQPAKASRSVTIKAKDAFTADAWSKVLFILGAKAAMPLVEKMADFDAVFVDDANAVTMSSGLKDVVKLVHAPTDGV